MNTFNTADSLPIHTAASQIFIVDVFFPSFTDISASVQQLLASDLNSYAHFLCFCSMLLFLDRYTVHYLTDLMKIYFSSWLFPLMIALSNCGKLQPSTYPTTTKHMIWSSPGYPLSCSPIRLTPLSPASVACKDKYTLMSFQTSTRKSLCNFHHEMDHSSSCTGAICSDSSVWQKRSRRISPSPASADCHKF